MMRLNVLAVAVLLVAGGAQAWGPATHGHIASCVTGGQNASVLFGAMLPDMSATLRDNPAEASQLNQLTHREFDRLAPSALTTGLKTHNALWGADYYAHLYYNPAADDIYSTVKIRQLSTEFGITMSQAEDVFEMCIDIQLRLVQGTDLGVRIAHAAQLSGTDHEQLLVDAYAAELAARVSGLSLEEAEQDIRTAVQAFKALTLAFGEQLQLSETEIHQAIPPILALYLGCDANTAAAYYNRCLEITGDFATELDRICNEIKTVMPNAVEGEDEGESEGEGEEVPVEIVVDFCQAFQQVYENPLLQGLDPQFAAFVELLNPATADLNGSFDVDSSSGALAISVNGNGILDAANELGVLARLLNYPEPFRSGIRAISISRAEALAAWQANRIQLNADIGALSSLLNSVVPGLKEVLLGFITLGDGAFNIASAPTAEEPDLPIIVSGQGSFGLVAALFATLDSMIAEELGTGFANPNLNLESYVTLPELLANADADGDGYTNQEEHQYFAEAACPVAYGKTTKENSLDIAYPEAALNYRLCPTCEKYCAECTPHGGFYAAGEDACLKVPGTFPPGTPFDWSKENSGPLFGARYEGVDCQTLRILNLAESDSGIYTCTYDATASAYSVRITVGASLPVGSPKVIMTMAVALLLSALIVLGSGCSVVTDAANRRLNAK